MFITVPTTVCLNNRVMIFFFISKETLSIFLLEEEAMYMDQNGLKIPNSGARYEILQP